MTIVIYTFWGYLFGAIIVELRIFKVSMSNKRGFLKFQLNWLVYTYSSIYEEIILLVYWFGVSFKVFFDQLMRLRHFFSSLHIIFPTNLNNYKA